MKVNQRDLSIGIRVVLAKVVIDSFTTLFILLLNCYELVRGCEISCPAQFVNKKNRDEINGQESCIFSSNTIVRWSFKDYLIWIEDGALRRLKTLYTNYKSSLNSLPVKEKMERELLKYVFWH
jgi:hypothetical protein